MDFKKIIVYFILLFSIIINVNSQACNNNYDEFVVTCQIPNKYFTQEFTCLNPDCSKLLRNDNEGYKLDLYIDGIFIDSIFRDNIPLKNMNGNLNLINQICAEKFNDETLFEINKILNNYEEKKWKYLGGNKLAIMKNVEVNKEKIILKYNENDKYLERCYNVKANESYNWLIPIKIVRPYCEIDYNSKDECFTTEIKYGKFMFYLILNPSFKSLGYLLTIITIFVSIVLIFDTLLFVYRKKRHREFFSFSKGKIKFFIIIIIPYLYLYGSIIGNIYNKRYDNLYLSPTMEIILVIAGILFLYLIICIGKYLEDKYELSTRILRKFGKL